MLDAWRDDPTLDHIIVATSVPLLYMGPIPTSLLYLAEKERSLCREELDNDTLALLDLLPMDRTTALAGDIHMYLRSQLCTSAHCLPQVCTSGITIGSTVGTSIKLFGFAALWRYPFPGHMGEWVSVHEDAAVVRNWLRLRYNPQGQHMGEPVLVAVPQLDPSSDWAIVGPQIAFEVLPGILQVLITIVTGLIAALIVMRELFAPPVAAAAPNAATGLSRAVGAAVAATERTGGAARRPRLNRDKPAGQ